MKDAVIFLAPLTLVLVLLGLLMWTEQDFANRCERMGGVTIDYEVCLPKGTVILMTR